MLSEAPRGKPRGIWLSAARLAIHPCGKLQGILAKASQQALPFRNSPAIRIAHYSVGLPSIASWRRREPDRLAKDGKPL